MKKTLKNVCDFFTGTGFPVIYQGKTDGELPFYKVGDVANNVINGHVYLKLCKNYISRKIAKDIKGIIVPKDTIVFAKIGEALKLNRRSITSTECLIDNNMLGICPKNQIVRTKYFYYFLKQLKMQNLAETTTVPSVKKSTLENVIINIPPLQNQLHIENILNTVSNIISNYQKELTQLDLLTQSLFVEMFGDLKVNNKHWNIVGFKDCATIDTKMVHDFKGYGDYPHIGIDCIEKETGRLLGYRTISEDKVISGKYLFTPNHIIYSKIRPNLNKVAMPEFSGLCSADAYPILVKEGICNREYLGYTLRSRYFLDYILTFSTRTNLPKVNRKQVESFSLPLPPIELQEHFTSLVKNIHKHKSVVQKSLDETQLLFDSLMQKYFG